MTGSKNRNRILSLVLAFFMVMSIMPLPTYAAELCDHHTEHTAECGYVEGVSDCTYHCDVCSGHDHEDKVAEEDTEPASVCDCGTDDGLIHATTCAVYVRPENPACKCAIKCNEDNVNTWCDVCGFDIFKCSGTDEDVPYADFTVTVSASENGTVTANPTTAAEGEIVTLTVVPHEGYALSTLAATYGENQSVAVDENNQFTMPAGDVTVTATFIARTSGDGWHVEESDGSFKLVITGSISGNPEIDVELAGVEVAQTGSITGGTFGNVTNYGTISGGYYKDVVNHGTITSGSFASQGEVTNNGLISGGTFKGSVTNESQITGGTFKGSVTNNGSITDGTFDGSVTNRKKINGGTFNSSVTNGQNGKITGGEFNSSVTNYGEITSRVTGVLEITGTVQNNGNGSIKKVKFTGEAKVEGTAPATVLHAVDGENKELTYGGEAVTNLLTALGTPGEGKAWYCGETAVGESDTVPLIYTSYTAEWIDYSVSIAETGNGSVSALVNGEEATIAHYGETVTLTVIPAEGYLVDTVAYNDTAITPVGGVYSFSMPAADVTVSATFKTCTHTGGEATCVSGKLCEICGVEYDTTKNPNNHTSEEFAYTANEDGTTHKKARKCCGETVDEAEAHTMVEATGKCICGVDMIVVSVNITWGAMSFTYTDGEWQPESHTYADGEWRPDNENGNVITVTNNGDVAVNVTFAYDKTVSEVAGSFTDESGNAITSPFALAVEEEKKIKLILNGQPSSTFENTELGTVTVKITLPEG